MNENNALFQNIQDKSTGIPVSSKATEDITKRSWLNLPAECTSKLKIWRYVGISVTIIA